MNNLSKLKGKKNHAGKSYYINVQQPEAINKARRNAKALMKKFEEKNKKLSADHQRKIKIKNNHVYINNVLEKQAV